MTLHELLTRWLGRMASRSRIPVQWQETYSDRKDTIWIKLWKTSIKRWPCGTNRDSKSERVSHGNTKKLETDDKGNRRNLEEHKEAVWQEKTKSSRTQDGRQRVVGKQKYPIKSTLKEVGQ